MSVTNYVWDPLSDNVLLETDESNVTQAVYTQEPDTFGNLISQRRDDATSWYHFDGLGSTRELTDEPETITDTNIYDAWAVDVTSTGTTENPFRWVGEVGYYDDAETGDYHVRARTYRPAIARWQSVDPVELLYVAGPNVFWYVTNQPVALSDPSGAAPPAFLPIPVAVGSTGGTGMNSGTFTVSLSSCAGSEELYDECCCSTVGVQYHPSPFQKRRYLYIRLRIYVQTKSDRSLCPAAGLVPWQPPNLTPWHSDDPHNKKEGHSDWSVKTPTYAAMWDDNPGGGPPEGRVFRNCPLFCRLDALQQDFEVCAIGTVRGVGAEKRELIGCVRYGHSCDLTYRETSFTSTCIRWCDINCNVDRYGKGAGRPPTRPQYSPWDPNAL